METGGSVVAQHAPKRTFFERGFWIAPLCAAVLVAGGTALLNLLVPDWRFVHYPLHAAVESVGAFAAFIIAVFILDLRRNAHLSTTYIWVASGLIGMGVLDGLHALQHQSVNFIWLHSAATFFGGMVFLLVWLKPRTTAPWWEKHVPRAVLGTALAIGVGSVLFPDYVPVMAADGQFTFPARVTNVVGGIGFIAAAWFFVSHRGRASNRRARLLFSIHCFLFGLSGIVFEFSYVWDGTWWFWHALRFTAYLIAVLFYFDLVRQLEIQLQNTTRNLEATVKERTESLLQEIEVRRGREASVRKLALAVQHSPVMIIITDAAGVIDYVNPEFTRLTGFTLSDVEGQTPRILRSPNTPPETHQDMWKSIKAGKIWRGEIQDRRKDGTDFWVSVLISPILDANEEIQNFVAVEEDVTTRRSAEQKRKEAHLAAETANKAKSEMLANMSHELRTPLNAIIGFSQAMRQGLYGPLGNSKYDEYVEHIEDSGQHLLEIINDVLDVSAIEAGKVDLLEADIDLIGVCEAAARLIGPKATEMGVDVVIDPASVPLTVYADERRMKQVVLNLVSNGIKFTPRDGRVTMSVAHAADGAAVLSVADTGIGMSEDEIAIAVSLFGQVDSGLDRKHEGSGLGLPLTKELMALHGGTLSIASTPGEGTTITVSLPADRVRGAGWQ